jgi:RecA-family ATPase
VGFGTLYHLATENGWNPGSDIQFSISKIDIDFEALERNAAAGSGPLTAGKDRSDDAPGDAAPDFAGLQQSKNEQPAAGNLKSELPKPGDQSARLQIIRPTEFQGLLVPARQWIVPDWIPRGCVTGIYGDGGVGKSLVAMQLQTAACVNKPWLSRPIAETDIRSLGFYCEDDKEELWRRQAAINNHYGCQFKDLTGCDWVSRVGADNLLMVFTSKGEGKLTALHKLVIEQCLDEKRTLLILDAVADGFGGNENDRSQVRQFVQHCLGSIALAIGAVVALAHPSRMGMATGTGDSGSTGWSNAFRSRMYLDRPKIEDGDQIANTNDRILTRKKANYAARDEELRLEWKNGVIQSKFMAYDSDSGADTRTPVDDVFMDLLDAINQQDRQVSASPNAGNFAPRLFATQAGANAGYTKKEFRAAMERLFTSGKIANEQYGRPGDQRYRIVRKRASA